VAASPSPGSRSPLRLGGIALLGVGVIAALAGLITTTQSGSTSTVAQAPTSSSAVLDPTGQAAAPPAPAIASPAPDAGTAAPNATPFVTGETGDGTAVGAAPPAAPEPAPAQPAAPPPAVAAPAPAPAPEAGGSGAAREPLRIYNNSKIQGLAARAAGDFREAGWSVAEIGGYPGAVIPTSTVYYRPGTSEQTAAETLAAQFGLRSEPRFAGIQDATPGLIVILTNDYQRR
jgi:hypothetical protein